LLRKRDSSESDYSNYPGFFNGGAAVNSAYKPADVAMSQRPNSAGATRRVHSGYVSNNKPTVAVVQGASGGQPSSYDPRYGGSTSGRSQQQSSAGVSAPNSGEVVRKRTIWTPSGIQTEYYTEKVQGAVGPTSSGNIPIIQHVEQQVRPKSAGAARSKSSAGTPSSAPSVTALPPAGMTEARMNTGSGGVTPILQPKQGSNEQRQVPTSTQGQQYYQQPTEPKNDWNTSYKLHYGAANVATANIQSGAISGQYSGHQVPDIAEDHGTPYASYTPEQIQQALVRASSAPPSRPSSASSRIRAAMKHGAGADTLGDEYDDGIANDDEENDELDAHLRDMALGGLIGASNRGNRPLTAFYEGVDDSGFDGGPRSRSHPEVSEPSHSVDLLGDRDSGILDIRNNSSLLSEQDLNNRVSAGLSTVPNQFCSVREAFELLKVIVNTKPGQLSSSSMVMDMYMVGKVVGVGSYGKVRAAWHRLTGSKVAIKTYDKAKFKDPEHWKRVQSEIKIMEQISHPRIARLFDAVETPKRMHLIMECLDGGNLCSYVKSKKRLSEEESKKIFFQLLQSIEYLHSYSVVHRDVKLENVLFNDTKDVKLIDFGFSTVCQKGKRLRVFCGTPSYMAPEIVRRSEYEGKPVDMWSLGILLYAILCGYFPFRAKNYPDLYRRIARGSFEIPEELSANAKDLIRQLLTMDPYQRLTAPAALKHPWLQAQLASAPDLAKLRLDTPILISEKASDDVDEHVLHELEEFGIAREDLMKQILSKTHSATVTLYYLLLDVTLSNRRNGTGNRNKANNAPLSTAQLLQGHMGSNPNNGVGTGGSSGSGVNWKKYAQNATYAPSPGLLGRGDNSGGANLLQGVLSSRPKSASATRVSGQPSGGSGVINGNHGGTMTGPSSSSRPHSAHAGRRS
jgi:serine/threonine protein kinase